MRRQGPLAKFESVLLAGGGQGSLLKEEIFYSVNAVLNRGRVTTAIGITSTTHRRQPLVTAQVS